MKTLYLSVLLAGAMAFPGFASAQVKTDLALTYTLERAKIAPGNCGCFWLNGGSADGAVTFFKGIGAAVNVTGESAANITPGVNLSKVSFMAGPRYTVSAAHLTDRFMKKHPAQVFGEWLFGGVHAFDGTFPAAGGAIASASSFAMQAGAGLDIALAKGFGVRALEVDYVRSTLPNNGSNSQNDLRLAFGVSFRR